jgi:hypothetical protein
VEGEDMRAISKIMLGAGAGAAMAAVRRISARRSGQRSAEADRWLTVTVYRPPDDVGSGDRLPRPLAELGDQIEVRIRPASGDKGTELAARLRQPGPDGPAARVAGQDPRQRVRRALREAKSLVETGEIVRPDPPSSHPGPGGRVVRLASRRAAGEGRL